MFCPLLKPLWKDRFTYLNVFEALLSKLNSLVLGKIVKYLLNKLLFIPFEAISLEIINFLAKIFLGLPPYILNSIKIRSVFDVPYDLDVMLVTILLKDLSLRLFAMDSAIVYDNGNGGLQTFAAQLLYEVHEGILVDTCTMHYHIVNYSSNGTCGHANGDELVWIVAAIPF